ncbi:MAG: glycosyltransferase family 4 protein [Planctomycetes bacterium]|nr:glycosyltransferase family 4 protein [Planctomycetota bacterium]
MVKQVQTLGITAELLFTCDIQRMNELSGFQFKHLKLPPVRKGKSLPFFPLALARLVNYLRSRCPDIVHLNQLDDAIFFILACRMAGGIPVVGHIRNLLPPKKFKKLWAHRLDRLICVSNAVCKQAIQGGVLPEKTLVVYDPPDSRWKEWPLEEERAEWQIKLGIPKGVPIIGTVGNISPIKGTDILIRSLPFVVFRYPEVRCIIVGGDDHGLKKELVILAERVGVSCNVIFTGILPDPRAVVSLMDIFVLPSREEGYGLVLLEAMSYGKPVIASRVGGVPEIINENETGVLVRPDDTQELAEAINLILGTPKLREHMGKKGRIKMHKNLEEFPWMKIYQTYTDLLQEQVV